MGFRNVILGLGIFLVYALVLWQGIQTFYPAPEYNDYCDYNNPRILPPNGDCDIPNDVRIQEQECLNDEGNFRYEYDNNGCVVGGYCDTCSVNYNDARDVYSRNVFIFSLVVGIIVFVLGLFVLSVEPVGSALLASGLWSIFYGTVVNWRNFGNGLRFGILLVVLIALIFFTLRLNKYGWNFWKKKGKKRKK